MENDGIVHDPKIFKTQQPFFYGWLFSQSINLQII